MVKMTKIDEAITNWFGERCPDAVAGCPCCDAWAELDALLAEHEVLLKKRDALVAEVARLREDNAQLSSKLSVAKSAYKAADFREAVIRGQLIDEQIKSARLRAALTEIASYEYPVIVGNYERVFYGEATGAEYISRTAIPKETAESALAAVKRISRAALGEQP